MLAAFRQERECDFALITKICAASTSLLNGSIYYAAAGDCDTRNQS